MPMYAGAVPDVRTLPTPKLVEMAWRAEAELAHLDAVRCEACSSIPALRYQLNYERSKARQELIRRRATVAQLVAIEKLAHKAAVENPDMHDFRLNYDPLKGTAPCDRTKASTPSTRTSSTGRSRSTATT